jgi:hypothetical protein
MPERKKGKSGKKVVQSSQNQGGSAGSMFLEAFLRNKDRPLSDNLPVSLEAFKLSHDSELPAPGDREATLVAEAGTLVDLRIYNDEGDVAPREDGSLPDPVISVEDEGGADDSHLESPPVLGPQIEFDGESAWLAYFTDYTLSLGAASKGTTAFGLKATSRVVLASHVLHEREELLGAAVSQDLRGAAFRSPLSAQDVRTLGPGDAVSVAVQGSIAFSSRVRWSDSVLSIVSQLNDILPGFSRVGVKVDTSAEVAVRFSISDAFRLVFAGKDERTILVALRKQESGEFGLSVAANIEAKLENPEELAKSATAMVSDWLHTPRSTIDRAKAALESARTKIPEEALPLVDALAKRYGIVAGSLTPEAIVKLIVGEDEAPPKAFLSFLTEKKQDLEKRIHTWLEQKLKASLSFDYKMSATDTTLIEAAVSRDRIANHHEDIVTFQLDNLLDEPPGVKILRYLHQRRRETSSIIAFGLTLGAWSVKQTRTEKARVVKTIDRHGNLALGADARLKYEGRRRNWAIDLKAETDEPVPGSRLRPGDIRWGLACRFEFTSDLDYRGAVWPTGFADFALCLGMLNESGGEAFAETLRQMAGKKGSVKLECRILLGNEETRGLATFLGDMPIELRSAGYAAAIAHDYLFGDEYLPVYALQLRRRIEELGPQYTLVASDRDLGSHGGGLQAIQLRHPNLGRYLDGLAEGFRQINRSDWTGLVRFEGVFDDTFNRMARFANEQLEAMMLGSMIGEFLRKRASIMGDGRSETGMRVTHTYEGKTKVRCFGLWNI